MMYSIHQSHFNSFLKQYLKFWWWILKFCILHNKSIYKCAKHNWAMIAPSCWLGDKFRFFAKIFEDERSENYHMGRNHKKCIWMSTNKLAFVFVFFRAPLIQQNSSFYFFMLWPTQTWHLYWRRKKIRKNCMPHWFMDLLQALRRVIFFSL